MSLQNKRCSALPVFVILINFFLTADTIHAFSGVATSELVCSSFVASHIVMMSTLLKNCKSEQNTQRTKHTGPGSAALQQNTNLPLITHRRIHCSCSSVRSVCCCSCSWFSSSACVRASCCVSSSCSARPQSSVPASFDLYTDSSPSIATRGDQ